MDRPNAIQRRVILLGLFVLNAASLAFEVLVTRIFSFLFVRSYVYIIISCSMAGIGFGSILLFFLKGPVRRWFLLILSTLPVVFFLLLLIVNSLSASLVVSLILTFFIFSSVGAMQAQVFQNSGIRSSLLYGTDLIGASLGVVLSYLSMNGIGVMPTAYLAVFCLAIGLIIAGVGFQSTKRQKNISLVLPVLLGAMVLVAGRFALGEKISPNRTWQKEMTVMLDEESGNPRITDTFWSSFGRVDMLETDNPLFRTMFIDGAAGTKMIEMVDGKVRPAVAENLLFSYMGGVPLLIIEEADRNRAAVIGSGGGIDVVTLLLAGYSTIDAVEINPDFIRIVKEHRAYNGGIYNDHPRVNIYNDEGRSFLRNQDDDYDLILMGLPIIKSSRNFTNYSLTENYLFTTNAFSEYLEALRPGGYLVVIAHYPNELKRLFSNAVKAVQGKYGVSDSIATQHIAAIGDDRNPTLILKSGVFSPSEVSGLNTILANLPVAGTTNFVPFSGESVGNVKFDPGFVALADDRVTLEDFIKIHTEDISWVTDDSPFFYQMSKKLPQELRTVLIVAAVLLIGSIAMFIARSYRKPNRGSNKISVLMLISFGMIGLGFMLVEIIIIQRFTVFWHHQTLALSVVLASILVSSGIGSYLSGFIKNSRSFSFSMAGLILLLILASLFTERILLNASDLSFGWKIPVTLILIIPMFIPMGMPFPYLLRKSQGISGTTSLFPWYIGFNSFATLAGGVLAIGIAMSLGYRFVFFFGIITYISMLFIQISLRKYE